MPDKSHLETLADLRRQLKEIRVERTRLSQRETNIQNAIRNLTAIYNAPTVAGAVKGFVDIIQGQQARYANMTLVNAVLDILKRNGSQTTSALAKKLTDGGYESSSDNFTTMVYNVLNRESHKEEARVRRVHRTWQLPA